MIPGFNAKARSVKQHSKSIFPSMDNDRNHSTLVSIDSSSRLWKIFAFILIIYYRMIDFSLHNTRLTGSWHYRRSGAPPYAFCNTCECLPPCHPVFDILTKSEHPHFSQWSLNTKVNPCLALLLHRALYSLVGSVACSPYSKILMISRSGHSSRPLEASPLGFAPLGRWHGQLHHDAIAAPTDGGLLHDPIDVISIL